MREGYHRDQVEAMTLEHYPGMTEQALEEIEAEAHRRWPLEATLIVHRYGRLEAGERIVLVAVGSPHREAAFEACEFLVDWLKTKAPFWKLEETPAGEKWVGAHEGDDAGRRAVGEEIALGARHSQWLRSSARDRRRATEWRAPSYMRCVDLPKPSLSGWRTSFWKSSIIARATGPAW